MSKEFISSKIVVPHKEGCKATAWVKEGSAPTPWRAGDAKIVHCDEDAAIRIIGEQFPHLQAYYEFTCGDVTCPANLLKRG